MKIILTKEDREIEKRIVLRGVAQHFGYTGWEEKSNEDFMTFLKGKINPELLHLLEDYFDKYNAWFDAHNMQTDKSEILELVHQKQKALKVLQEGLSNSQH